MSIIPAIASTLSKAEKTYIHASLPQRTDGRTPAAFRPLSLELSCAPLASGSARVRIGGAGGTEVVVGVKLEMEDVGMDGMGGMVACTVSCSPPAYPHLSPAVLDDHQADLTNLLHSTLSHPTLRPVNLTVLQGKKAWAVYVDALVLGDAGNVVDALFIAACAALCETRVPRTRGVEYKTPAASGAGTSMLKTAGGAEAMDVDADGSTKSAFNTAGTSTASDFELLDYWDGGEPLEGAEACPVCVTLHIHEDEHFVDATSEEEVAVPLRLHLFFSFHSKSPSAVSLQGMRLVGPGEVTLSKMKKLIKEGEGYARSLHGALEEEMKGGRRLRAVKM